MKWIDILAWSLNNLRRRKLRSALTMLGVVIGTMAIVVTISLGYGAQATQMKQLEEMTNLRQITVFPHWGGRDVEGDTSGSATRPRITKLTDQVVSRFRRIPGVTAVTPVIYVWSRMEFVIGTGKLEASVPLVAVSPRDFAKFVKLKEGHHLSGSLDKMEFILSEATMMEFKDPKKPTDSVDIWPYMEQGKDLPLPKVNWLNAPYTLQLRWEDIEKTDAKGDPIEYTKDYKAKLVGTIKADYRDPNFNTFGYYAVVNMNWLKKLSRDNRALFKEMDMPDYKTYDQVYVLAKTVDDVEDVVKELTEIGVQPDNPLMWVKSMQDQIATVQGFLGFIGAVSMAVAALSIANTMMMSIYERTREIGVMKVLGCKLGNIRMLFLSEAAFIGLFGGGMGLAMSYALSYALNNVAWLQQMVASVMSNTALFTEGSSTSVIPPALSLGTWAGVVGVSILSGMYPAQRAMGLSSLAAIRNAD